MIQKILYPLFPLTFKFPPMPHNNNVSFFFYDNHVFFFFVKICLCFNSLLLIVEYFLPTNPGSLLPQRGRQLVFPQTRFFQNSLVFCGLCMPVRKQFFKLHMKSFIVANFRPYLRTSSGKNDATSPNSTQVKNKHGFQRMSLVQTRPKLTQILNQNKGEA